MLDIRKADNGKNNKVVENGSKESFIDRENMHLHIHSDLLRYEMAWGFCDCDNL